MENLNKNEGIDGYFFASVLSPKFFKTNLDECGTHAIIIDKNMNIIHDPNKNYEKILQYPLGDIIDCNGIFEVYLINPISK